MQLAIDVRREAAPTVLSLTGEVDLLTAPQLRERLHVVPDGDLVLDLSGVEFFSAAGLRVLHEAHERRQAAGTTMMLTAVPGRINRLLRITGLLTVLCVVGTAEDAVTMLAPPELVSPELTPPGQ